MTKTYKIDDIYTEDAAEIIHELSDEDFINVFKELINRRKNLYSSKSFNDFKNDINTMINRF